MDQSSLLSEIAKDSSINDFLESDEIIDAVTDALRETGWSFPMTENFKCLWIKSRTKRYCFNLLWTGAARKFKVEQLSLNQRFDHYGKVIEKMDNDFEKAKEENPDEFIASGSDLRVNMFGTVSGPGFVYDIAGNDVTRLVD